MPDFNFKPAVMGTRFYRGGRGVPEDENITKIELENNDDIFELGFELTLGGLNYLKYPNDYLELLNDKELNNEGFKPFFLNFIFYYQRGMKDSLLISHNSIYISVNMLKQESINIAYTLTKFRNDIENIFEDDLKPDFISGIYHLNISISENEIELKNEDDFGNVVFNNHNTIFQTKIPYIYKERLRNE